jgi:plastocyanin
MKRALVAAFAGVALWAAAGGCGDCDNSCGSAPIFDLAMGRMDDLWLVKDLTITSAGVVMVGAGAANTFSPSTVTIKPGESVTWSWVSGVHGVVSDTAPKAFADSPTQSSGQYTATFATAGTYPYHCAVHGTMMTGTVVVQP